jgi:hypothetical protein
MTPTKRILWGAGLGFLLQALAFILNIREGQTQVLFVLNAGVPGLFPGIGIIIAAFVPPFLWAAYFYYLPTFTFKKRALIFTAILFFHAAPVIWLAITDGISVRVAAREQTLFLAAYSVVAVVTFLSLVFVAFKNEHVAPMRVHRSSAK